MSVHRSISRLARVVTMFTAAAVLVAWPGAGTRGAGSGTSVRAQDTLAVGQDAPGFVMDNLTSGEPVFLSDFAGRTLRQPWKSSVRSVVVLCFWSSTSPSSNAEISELSHVAATLAGKPVAFFLVNTRERAGTTAEAIKAVVVERGYRLPVLLDATGTVADRYGVETVPMTIVVDKYGVLKLLHSGPGSTANGKLEQLLAVLAQVP